LNREDIMSLITHITEVPTKKHGVWIFLMARRQKSGIPQKKKSLHLCHFTKKVTDNAGSVIGTGTVPDTEKAQKWVKMIRFGQKNCLEAVSDCFIKPGDKA